MPTILCSACEEEFDIDNTRGGYCGECLDEIESGQEAVPVDVYMTLREKRFYRRDDD